MSDRESVYEARRKVANVYNARLQSAYQARLNVPGSGDKNKALNPPALDVGTGGWTGGEEHKPPGWVVAFELTQGNVVVGPTEGRRPNRILGTYNVTTRSLRGILARVFPVLKETANAANTYTRHPYWEWALAFVFPGPATFIETGSAAATMDFDPATGILSSTIDDKKYDQPYVSADLIGLVPPDDLWSQGSTLTYKVATDALSQYVHVDVVQGTTDVIVPEAAAPTADGIAAGLTE